MENRQTVVIRSLVPTVSMAVGMQTPLPLLADFVSSNPVPPHRSLIDVGLTMQIDPQTLIISDGIQNVDYSAVTPSFAVAVAAFNPVNSQVILLHKPMHARLVNPFENVIKVYDADGNDSVSFNINTLVDFVFAPSFEVTQGSSQISNALFIYIAVTDTYWCINTGVTDTPTFGEELDSKLSSSTHYGIAVIKNVLTPYSNPATLLAVTCDSTKRTAYIRPASGEYGCTGSQSAAFDKHVTAANGTLTMNSYGCSVSGRVNLTSTAFGDGNDPQFMLNFLRELDQTLSINVEDDPTINTSGSDQDYPRV